MVQISIDIDMNGTEDQVSEEDKLMNDILNLLHFDRDTNKVNECRQRWFNAASNGNIDDIKSYLHSGAGIGWENDEKSTALHICASYGHNELVSLLLDAGAAVDAKDEDSSTALHLAVWYGHTDVVSLLLNHDADIESTDDHSETALHMAASRKNRKLVLLLLSHGAVVDSNKKQSNTALHLASMTGRKDIVGLLLKHGASVAAKGRDLETPLHLAARNGHKEVVQLLLHYGAAVDAKDELSETPLHEAARNGHIDVVQLLINQGINVDSKDKYLDTALHQAAFSGQKEVVQLLLNHGSAVDSKNQYFQTPLYCAASNGQKEVIQLLLNHGAFVDAKDERLCTAFHAAATDGDKEVVELLLNHGAAVETKSEFLDTALHVAARDGHKDIVHILLNHGASVEAKNKSLDTPLHNAARNGHTEVVVLLLNHDHSVEAKNKHLNTALHLAAVDGHTDITELLLQQGTAVDATSQSSNTALHLASSNGHKDIVDLLLKYGASIDAKNDESRTALHLAAINGYKAVVSQLLGNYETVNQELEHGNSVHAELSESDDVRIENLVTIRGADIEALDKYDQTPFMVAAKAGQLDIVSLLIDKGANLEATDKDSMTVLHWAAKDGNVDLVEFLLQKDVQTEVTTKHGATALHLAVEFNHFNIVTTLLKYGANIDAENENQKTPIQVAIWKGNIDIVYQLKYVGATIAGSEDNELWMIYAAAEAGQIALVKRELDMISNAEMRTYCMNASLCRASQHGQVDMVSYLLDRGTDIEVCNEDGYRPLFLAAQHPEMISMLINGGACIEARNERKRNQTALNYFASLGQIEALRILLNYDCNIHSTDSSNNTALHYAATKGYCEIANLLVKQGIDINSKNDQDETALHIAIRNDFLDLASLLIDYGVDIDAKTRFMKSTALHIATRKENSKAISLLLSRNADVNAKEAGGETVLHLAIEFNLAKECALIIEHGANVNSISKFYVTPLAIAVNRNNHELVSLLLAHGASVHNLDYTQIAIHTSHIANIETGDSWERRFIAMMTLLINAGADTAGIQLPQAFENGFPTLVDTLTKLSNQSISKKTPSLKISPVIVDEHVDDVNQTDALLKEFNGDSSNQYEIAARNKRWLNLTEHKYGYGFPLSKHLQLDNFKVTHENDDSHNPARSIPSEPSLQLFKAVSIEERAVIVIQSLLDSFNAKLFFSDYFFMLEMDRYADAMPPKMASEFDKMKGIIREPGRLIVHIPQKETILSIPAWHNSDHPYLRFIDAVYVCRRASPRVHHEAFSNLLGGSEQKTTTNLHAILITGLSILSIAGGDGLIEKLVMAILGEKLDPIHSTPRNAASMDWKVRNRRLCPCNADSAHLPLSPVAAAKAVGINIWRERQEEIVNRVWDLQQDKLAENIDARNVIFITHRWSHGEVKYQDVMNTKSLNGQGISGMSEKLHRIREALLNHTRYVWIDTICIDKSNLSELDEVIRSMYKWYANCAAVVLDSGTPLDVWCKRGWCLQEGAAAGVLCGISKIGTLATIQQLAIEQQHDLCILDLHLYYRPGNASEILARMNIRNTTRKEDKAYALTGIFSIHLTLAYGEGIKSRERLLHELATQKGDLSFLSFMTTHTTVQNYLPTISDTNYLIANCRKSSAPPIVSHFGVCFEVQLVKGPDASQILQRLKSWKNLKFAKGRCLGVEELIEVAERSEHQNSPSIELAIVHDIRSIMLVETHNTDWQTGGERPIKVCYRLQCCQIEENEFERLFDEIDAEFERMWLGDKADTEDTKTKESERSRHRGRRKRKSEDNVKMHDDSDLGPLTIK